MRPFLSLLLATALSIVVPSAAQEATGSVSGNVKDASTKLPLIEAVITLSAPELNGKRLSVTDSLGNYKVVNLPAGLYTIMFEMEGYQKLSKENIQISSGVPVGLNPEMVREKPASKHSLADDLTTHYPLGYKRLHGLSYIL